PVRVKLGVYDAAFSMIEIAIQTRLLADMFGEATSDIIPNTLGDPFVCKDEGLVGINFYGKDVWQRGCKAMDKPEYANDERFIETVGRWANGQALREIVDPWCASLPRDEVMRKLRENLIPAAPIIGCDELLKEEQVVAREIIVSDGEHPAVV